MSESEREELDVDEQIVYTSNYFGGYVSKLTDRETGSFYAFVDFNADNVGRIKECPHCLKYDFHYKLQPKILQKGEQKEPDYDQWLSCYECGNTFPIYETFTESKIKDSVETTGNPFENESIFLSTDNRAMERKKGIKRSRFKAGESDPDPEIQREIRQHDERNVHIHL